MENEAHVVGFVSRNKDNKGLENFKERRRFFLTKKTPEELTDVFTSFVNNGVDGEMCRMYRSVNAREMSSVVKKVMHMLVDNPEFNLCTLDSKIASLAMDKSCSVTNKWLLDFDKVEALEDNDMDLLLFHFLRDMERVAKLNTKDYFYKKTVNGYAVVVNHGFDTRELLGTYTNVENKKDGMLFCMSGVK